MFVACGNGGDLALAVTRLGKTTILFRNRTNNRNYLNVRVVGAGDGETNKAAIGTRAELWSIGGTEFLARRDVGIARGGGTEPIWLHIGGVSPNSTYEDRVQFANGMVKKSVDPANATSSIGGRDIPQICTVEEKVGVKVIQWSEVRNRAAPGN